MRRIKFINKHSMFSFQGGEGALVSFASLGVPHFGSVENLLVEVSSNLAGSLHVVFLLVVLGLLSSGCLLVLIQFLSVIESLGLKIAVSLLDGVIALRNGGGQSLLSSAVLSCLLVVDSSLLVDTSLQLSAAIFVLEEVVM